MRRAVTTVARTGSDGPTRKLLCKTQFLLGQRVTVGKLTGRRDQVDGKVPVHLFSTRFGPMRRL